MMLTRDIGLIQSPVVVILNAEEKEYANGADAVNGLERHNRLEVKSIAVKNNKIVVTLAEWESTPPANFIGEAAVE